MSRYGKRRGRSYTRKPTAPDRQRTDVGIHRLRSLQPLLNFHFWAASVRPFRFL